MLELPHTLGCLVCGRDNPRGLHLHLAIDPETGRLEVPFTPAVEHVGFNGIIHGGILATVIDEAMAWAAAWPGRCFCVCAEMTVRFRKSARIGRPMRVAADVVSNRRRLIETAAEARDDEGEILAVATGKYTPMPPEMNARMLRTLVREPETAQAYAWLMG